MNEKERAAWQKSRKYGDEVMVMRFNVPLRTRRIIAVTKSGRVRVSRNGLCTDKPVEFDSDGTVRGERGSTWSRHLGDWERTSIEPATDELKEKLAALRAEQKLTRWRDNLRREINHVDWDLCLSLTDDQLRAIEAILWPPKPAEVPPAPVVEDPAPLAAGAARGGDET